jgi:hypothetical protein
LAGAIPAFSIAQQWALILCTNTMSFGRVLLLGTAAIGGTFIAMKPETRQKVKQIVAVRLHRLGNLLDPQGPPPMWTDAAEPDTTVPAAQDESIGPADESEEEDRTIQGFKVKK